MWGIILCNEVTNVALTKMGKPGGRTDFRGESVWFQTPALRCHIHVETSNLQPAVYVSPAQRQGHESVSPKKTELGMERLEEVTYGAGTDETRARMSPRPSTV